MTITELAAHDAADRLRVCEAALAASRAALAQAQQRAARTDAIAAHISRLVQRRAALAEAVAA